MALGRFPESIAHMERAEQLDPLSSTVQSGFGRVLYRARRFEEAISHLNRAIALEPQSRMDIAGLQTYMRKWAGMPKRLPCKKRPAPYGTTHPDAASSGTHLCPYGQA